MSSGAPVGLDDREAARRTALRLLERREHSARELRAKLLQRGYSAEIADAVTADLRGAGWQSDNRYAEVLTQARNSRGYGPLRIRAELRAKGVDDATITGCLAELANEWAPRAAEVRRQRFGAGAPIDRAELGRQWRFLIQRGFSEDQIRYAFAAADRDATD